MNKERRLARTFKTWLKKQPRNTIFKVETPINSHLRIHGCLRIIDLMNPSLREQMEEFDHVPMLVSIMMEGFNQEEALAIQNMLRSNFKQSRMYQGEC